MEIVRRGADPTKQPIQAECSRCYTVIKFLPLEAKYCSDQREGDFYSIACPVCASTITAQVQRGYNGPG